MLEAIHKGGRNSREPEILFLDSRLLSVCVHALFSSEDLTKTISMLTVAGVSDKVIKKIVGHKGHGVTEVVYTHFEIEELIDAINKI